MWKKENGKLRCLNDSLTKQLKQKHGKLESALISVVWCILFSFKCFYWYFSILNETAILSPHPSYLFTFSLHQLLLLNLSKTRYSIKQKIEVYYLSKWPSHLEWHLRLLQTLARFWNRTIDWYENVCFILYEVCSQRNSSESLLSETF